MSKAPFSFPFLVLKVCKIQPTSFHEAAVALLCLLRVRFPDIITIISYAKFLPFIMILVSSILYDFFFFPHNAVSPLNSMVLSVAYWSHCF